MKLVKLNTTLLPARAIHVHEPPQPTDRYNTSFHPASSAPSLLRPLDTPYSYARWLPLILCTRAPPTTPSLCPAVQTIRLTRAQTALLHSAAEASLPRGDGEVNRLFREDLEDTIIPVLEREVIFPPEGLFVRFDEFSPKDGAGPAAIGNAGEVVRKVVTSVRARNVLGNFLEDKGESEGVEMFFMRWDGRMAAEREYRVFCRPGDGKVSAVSQYRWWTGWRFGGVGEEEQERVVKRVRRGAEEVRGLILEEAERRGEEEDRLLVEQGFSFDLLYDEDGDTCELVELNTFGVRSACGSCLFQWVDDRRVLYGEEEAEFRVATSGIEGFVSFDMIQEGHGVVS
ncbi:putative cell division cycle 123 protein [Staphylotrichum tortipilum]|uniref:Cell division cycle 123 protein n=1 Tax=Staphylotrichum tortipilum TaxID=2831512 RepID=A0AAN6MU74_9PEZI|nr:putative cell division cycle 123 protein [Staphylotrichum longicolle]